MTVSPTAPPYDEVNIVATTSLLTENSNNARGNLDVSAVNTTISDQKKLRKLEFSKILCEKYPVRYVVIHSTVIAILSTLAFMLQIMLLTNDIRLSRLSSGVWIFFYFLMTIAVTLAISIELKSTIFCNLRLLYFFL